MLPPTLDIPLLEARSKYIAANHKVNRCRRGLTATVTLTAALLVVGVLLEYPVWNGASLWLRSRPDVAAVAPRLRVLVTGYLPFANMTTNPAADVAAALNRSCVHGVCFEGVGLPVDRAGAMHVASTLSQLPSRSPAPWDAVVHLGFESIAQGLRVEVAAANVLSNDSVHGWSVDVPCNKSNSSQYNEIVPGGPCLLATTAALDRVFLDESSASRMRLTHPAEVWSRDAGVFYCNEVLYRSLWEVRTRRLRPHAGDTDALLPVVFVHLPPTSLAPVSAATEVVARLGAMLVGRRLPSMLPPVRAAAMPALCPAPSGRYEGQAHAWGYAIRIAVEVAGAWPGAPGGRLHVDVAGAVTFACDDEAWSLLQPSERRAADGITRLAAVSVNGDECWRREVLDDLAMWYDAMANAIVLEGFYRVGGVVRVGVRATLRARGECLHAP